MSWQHLHQPVWLERCTRVNMLYSLYLSLQQLLMPGIVNARELIPLWGLVLLWLVLLWLILLWLVLLCSDDTISCLESARG